MGGFKVLVVLGIVVVVVVKAAAAIIPLVPWILAIILLLAIAEGRVRLSVRKDETHSPDQTRPGVG